jgi:hypothetical protein
MSPRFWHVGQELLFNAAIKFFPIGMVIKDAFVNI